VVGDLDARRALEHARDRASGRAANLEWAVSVLPASELRRGRRRSAEGIALPLVHSAWITAVVFTLANAALLFVRIRVEDRALEATA
jgi:hypothetical protein